MLLTLQKARNLLAWIDVVCELSCGEMCTQTRTISKRKMHFRQGQVVQYRPQTCLEQDSGKLYLLHQRIVSLHHVGYDFRINKCPGINVPQEVQMAPPAIWHFEVVKDDWQLGKQTQSVLRIDNF